MKRICIADDIIEYANSEKDTDKRLKILWAVVEYALTKRIAIEELSHLLDPNKRRAEKMTWNKNRCGTTEKTDMPQLNTVMPQLKNSSATTEKNRHATTENASRELKKVENVDESLSIYISNNNILYNIISKYISNNISTPSINYQISKQWEEKYLLSQIKEAEKIVNKIWLETFETILNYIAQDEFWSKNILSISKLNRKNKEWLPYYVVIMDKIKQYRPKVVSIPTI